jgi:hypothetical protein
MNQFRKAIYDVCTVAEMSLSEMKQKRACIEKRFMVSHKISSFDHNFG